MQSRSETPLVLSIESAVAGGSIALLSGMSGPVIERTGEDCSRAEKIVPIIRGILDEAQTRLQDLDLIAVSTGPGSYSGIRIGLSTALGLARSAGLPCVGVSVLEAMACSTPVDEPFASAVPVGKNDVASQIFRPARGGTPSSQDDAVLRSLSSFVATIDSTTPPIFAPADLIARIGSQLDGSPNMVVAASSCLAEYVGKLAMTREPGGPIDPIYLRNREVARPGAF